MRTNHLDLLTKRVLFSTALATAFAVGTPTPAMAGKTKVASVNQQQTVKGTVVEASGEPVIGATVRVDGSKAAAITDLDGNFTIALESGNSGTLTVSFVGFKNETVHFTAGTPLKVVLKEDTKQLDDVVVVGFGTQKKVNLTGAVSVVTSEQFEQRPVNSAAQALQGAVPGLQIQNTSGQVNATPSINVRGTATIGQGTSGSPLILIDGSEGDINTINPQDIESISVLKDAAASSIYGSRAPFGVILITTKTGKKGKVSVNYNNSFRFSNLIRGKHMMNSVDFASWMNDISTALGGSPQFSDERMAAIKAYHEATPVGPGTRRAPDGTLLYGISSTDGDKYWDDAYANAVDDVDWYDAIYRGSTFSQEHNASISGATDAVNYYVSFNYLDNQGFMKLSDDKFSRYASSAKLGIKVTDWLNLNYNMRYTRTDYRRPSGLTDTMYSDLARQGWPVLPLYDRNGYYFDAPSPALGMAEGGKDTTQRDIINQRFELVFEPVKNWITHVDFNYQFDNSTRHWDSQVTYNHDIDGKPYVYGSGNSNVHEDEKKENYLNFQAYSEYSFTLAQKNNFHVMAGFQAEQLKQLVFGLQTNGILDPSKPEIDTTTGAGGDGSAIVPATNGARNQWQTAGFFGRFNYNFDERYLLEFNIRRDGSSRFRRDKMWKTFPSVSLGWNIANEKFFSKLSKTVNLLKLRASYGSLGNQNTTDWYRTYQTITFNPNAGGWLQNGLKPNTTSAPGLVSPTLTWEKVESYDIGLDFAVLNNRLTGTFDWYIRDTKDMVGNAPELPAVLGTGVPVTNNTDLRTRGWEFQVAWRDVLHNGLSYGVAFNMSDARTKITRYPNNPTNSIDTYISGRYINEIWGYETIGIAKSDDEMKNHLATTDQSSLGSNWAAGDIMYKDLDGDNKISEGSRTLADHGDLKVIGNSTPRYLFGLDLNASWKGFDVRAFFQGVMKRDFWIGGNYSGASYLFGVTGAGKWWSAGITDVQDYFRNGDSWSVRNGYQSENLNSYLPRPQESDKNLQVQSRYLLNAAYMRLKNFQIGYTVPRKLVSQWGVQNLRVFFSAENLFTITDMPHQFDPELIGTSSAGSNGYPLSRTFSFGINVTL